MSRNLTRLREMGNTVLEGTERERGKGAIAQILEQLIDALTHVGERADVEKKAADRARIDAEVNEGEEGTNRQGYLFVFFQVAGYIPRVQREEVKRMVNQGFKIGIDAGGLIFYNTVPSRI